MATISPADLRKVAKARLADAEQLFDTGRFDGAIYLCGYVIEMALKARIWKHLKWSGFPQGEGDWSSHHKVYKKHDFEFLLEFTGCKAKIMSHVQHKIDWSLVNKEWSPDLRYVSPGVTTPALAQSMIEATKRLLKAI